MPVRPDSDDVDLRSLSTEGREVLMLQAAKGYYNSTAPWRTSPSSSA